MIQLFFQADLQIPKHLFPLQEFLNIYHESLWQSGGAYGTLLRLLFNA